ncbi:hypothetical protein AB4495_04625 [Vibrio splendidus]
MNNTQAIYDGIISKLENLISQESIGILEEHCNEDEAKVARLYDIEEQLKEKLEELVTYRTATTLYAGFNDIYIVIYENSEILNNQTSISISDLLLSLKLAKKLEGSFESIPTEDIVPFSDFTIFSDLSDYYIDIEFYLHIGDSNYNNTILFINQHEDNSNLINDEIIIPDPIIILILSFLNTYSLEQCKKLLVIKTDDENTNINKSIAALKLHLVCSGKSYHKVEVTNRNNFSTFKNAIKLNNNYNQFDDSLMILSEYNSRNELLNKFLSIYHLVENFMCRYPLVKLQNQYQGKMFSIRNFKGMYDDLDGKEIHMIRNLFKVLYSTEYKGNSFLLKAHTNFKELVSNSIMLENDIDNALLKLGMIHKGTALTYATISSYTPGQVNNDLPQKLADMVYGIRNAIVHNKETEFHLSHEYMEPCIYTFINSYVLTILESILLDLIVEENNIIWYPHSKIKLYEE